jgi:hypothetical protein
MAVLLAPDHSSHEQQFDRRSIPEPEPKGRGFAVGVEPSNLRVTNFRRLPHHLWPFMILTLYDTRFFRVPIILVSEPEWRLQRVLSRTPRETIRYKITESEWARFETFVKLCEIGLRSASDHYTPESLAEWRKWGGRGLILPGWKRLAIAARHYLAATFATGDPLPELGIRREWVISPRSDVVYAPHGWSAEESLIEELLLRYVFALEALLGLTNERGRQQVAPRVAVLIGRDQRERRRIAFIVEKAFRIRNKLVHGQIPDDKPPLVDLRKICQRTIAASLCIGSDVLEMDRFEETLADLGPGKHLSDKIRRGCDDILSLLKDKSPIQ